ncbi:MAG: AbrB/MazE/SpoVT family DNA-binding domain-containing protein [Spirochaetota bacterium]
MKAELVRIGNSRGLRLPRRLLALYAIEEGDELELEERLEGILIRPLAKGEARIGWADAYREMSLEVAESAEWADWDSLAGEGLAEDPACD